MKKVFEFKSNGDMSYKDAELLEMVSEKIVSFVDEKTTKKGKYKITVTVERGKK